MTQEAQALQQISELRRTGMWSARQLPKVQEASRCKSHWDYVLDEMQWLAVDFAQERRWKMAAARKVIDISTICTSDCILQCLFWLHRVLLIRRFKMMAAEYLLNTRNMAAQLGLFWES